MGACVQQHEQISKENLVTFKVETSNLNHQDEPVISKAAVIKNNSKKAVDYSSHVDAILKLQRMVRTKLNRKNQYVFKRVEVTSGIYLGGVLAGIINGFGVIIHKSNDKYVGYWNDEVASGLGYYEAVKGITYKGLWKNNKQHEFGQEVWEENNSYIGDYRNGEKHGVGRMQLESGVVYEGEFKSNKMHGIGKLIYADGRSYEGEFKNNKMCGIGELRWPDGKFYKGEFVSDKREGNGIFFINNKLYCGKWKNNNLIDEVFVIENGDLKLFSYKHSRKQKQVELPESLPVEAFKKKLIEMEII